ncbi:MAG: membrane protein insertase YidC [Lactobacillales bacterium]|jgi:YidC/Oxa1 family membrane protein insertase|nr:membrane protein insertase YidC [Lactobacillales bacterium]
MKNVKRLLFGGSILISLLLLSGCVKVDKSGRPTGEGWAYHFLMEPMSNFLDYLAKNFHMNYGFAIIFVTLVVRFILMPLFFRQMHAGAIQQEKMQLLNTYAKPINERIKNAKTQEEKMTANMELQKFYKENGVNMLGSMSAGCLPMLLQMPIFSALYFTARYNEGILKTYFFGIDLAKRSVVLLVIIGILYLIQSYISLIGLDDEQKEKMKMMTFMSPIMTVMVGLTMPAGVQLYWVAGGVVAIVQQCISSFIIKPKVHKQVDEEFRDNPPKKPAQTVKKDVTPKEGPKPKSLNYTSGKGRNAGKQQRKKEEF